MSSKNLTTFPSFGSTFPMTMSSLEVAELVESRHDNVRISIERLAERGVIQLPAAQISEKINNLGLPQKTKIYNLEKRDSFVVVAQLSPEFTARLVDRWQELEAGRPMMTRLELAKEQVRLIEELEAAEEKVATLNVELDYAHEWATIKRVEHATGEKYCWRKLKAGSVEIDCPRKDIFDANYGTVKSYHADLWKHCYGLDLNKVFGSTKQIEAT